MNEYKGIMPTKIELTLEQSQQGVSNDVLVQPTSSESTAHVQPLVVQSSHNPSEPASAPAPTKPSYAHNNNSFEELPKRNPY
ncbi:hypothetical protein Tco_0967819 [Tanacetum coccineum]